MDDDICKGAREAAWRWMDGAEVVLSEAQVEQAVDKVAREIRRDYQKRHPLLIAIMGGSVVFAGDLLKRLDFPLEFDTAVVSRYRSDLVGSSVEWRSRPRIEVAGRDVLLVEDILDAGVTLAAVRAELLGLGAKTVEMAVFCEKDFGERANAAKPARARYLGAMVPDRFVFGYGMDAAGAWRNLPRVMAAKS